MATSVQLFEAANVLYSRRNPETETRPPIYKAIGISLAVASGLFIGVSFVLKKVGLLKSNVKYNEAAGEGYSYLKNSFWWTGMTLMIIGEICNFVAYAFVDAILVTPMGALSVVVTAILSAIFLKERLSLVGKVGCFLCIVGSVVIVMNAPSESSAATIQEMQHFVISPGFLSYAGIIIVASALTAMWAGPRYGKKTMMVYISICSLVGGLSVVATQGLGAAIVAQIGGTPQFNQWFLYVLLVFVVATLLTEIIYLNKALNLFNAALVTPTYYVFFTSSTIITSAILFRGFKGTPTSIVTCVMGFFVICAGVVLLQLSKSAKDVPDAAVFAGNVDQIRTIAEQEQPESEPKADAIRGAAAIVRRISITRQKMEMEEAKRIQEEKQRDLEPIGEDERIEWDGLRRRRTGLGRSQPTISPRLGEISQHPPLGMSHFPAEEGGDAESRPKTAFSGSSFFESLKGRTRSMPGPGPASSGIPYDGNSSMHPVPLTEIAMPGQKTHAATLAFYGQSDGTDDVYERPFRGQNTVYEGVRFSDNVNGSHLSGDLSEALPFSQGPSSRASLAPTPPPHFAGRQFSFQSIFGKQHDQVEDGSMKSPKSGARNSGHKQVVGATEEETLGLVKGDSHHGFLPPLPAYNEEDEGLWNLDGKAPSSPLQESRTCPDELEQYQQHRRKWSQSRRESPGPSSPPRKGSGNGSSSGNAFI